MIGRRWKRSNALSLPVLMVEGLTLYQAPLRSDGDSRFVDFGSHWARAVFCVQVPLPSRASTCRGAERGRMGHALRLARQFGWSARDGAAVARRAHNPKVGGSNPSPATKIRKRSRLARGGFVVCRGRAMRLHAADVAADRSRYRSRGGRQGNSATCSPVALATSAFVTR